MLAMKRVVLTLEGNQVDIFKEMLEDTIGKYCRKKGFYESCPDESIFVDEKQDLENKINVLGEIERDFCSGSYGYKINAEQYYGTKESWENIVSKRLEEKKQAEKELFEIKIEQDKLQNLDADDFTENDRMASVNYYNRELELLDKLTEINDEIKRWL